MSADVARVLIGRPPGGMVELVVYGAARAASGPDPDGCIHTEVTISAGAFSGSYFAYFRGDELEEFRRALVVLAETRTGRAELYSLDGWLDVRLRAAAAGVDGNGVANDQQGNAVTFSITASYDDLDRVAGEIDHVLVNFPVGGGR